MSDECVFCEIASGKIPSTTVYEDEFALAVRDIYPKAPIHILIIPRKHIPTLNDLTPDDETLVGHLLLVAKHIAQQEGISDSGYRTVFNCGEGAGQSVFHIHLHLLGGRPFDWPPG